MKLLIALTMMPEAALVARDGRSKFMYECFHYGLRAVIWDCDYDFEDYGYEGEGIVHACHCSNCGAEIEYRIPICEAVEDEP